MTTHRVMQNPGGCRPFLTSDYADEVLADNPVAYWQYQDCDGYPVDSSGNGYDMTAEDGSPYREYRFDGPLTLPQDRSIRQAGGSRFRRSVVTTATDNWTVEMWLFLQICSDANQTVFYNGEHAAPGDGWGLVTQLTAGVINLQYWASGVVLGPLSTTGLSLNTWYHVAMKRDTGTLTYYLNGSPDGTQAGSGTPNTPTVRTTDHTSATIQRAQAHIAVYETALSDARIAAHYAAA